MIKISPRMLFILLLGFVLTLASNSQVALADGTETLGPASIPIASGTGIVSNGVGLEDGQVPTFDLAVPANATVKQVLLYWSGGAVGDGNAGDNTIKVNGVDVTGTLIGGPTFFFSRKSGRYYFSTYRADITNLGIVSPGNNSVTITDMNFSVDENNGAGIMAIIDDGSTPATIQIRDGLDLAFINFPGLRNSTVKQTITFAAAGIDRVATMPMFFGSVAYDPVNRPRPSSIEIWVEGSATPIIFSNLLDSNNGPEWDSDTIQVPIPAGVTSFTVQAFSRDDNGDGQDPLAASFTWLATSVVLKPEQEQPLLSLGNRIWNDNAGTDVTTNPNFNNGLLDNGESGIAGVSLQLLNGDSTPFDLDPNTGGVQPYQVTTDATGTYTFTQLPAGTYRVQVLQSNFNAGGPLENFVSSADRATSANPDNDIDNDDNGIGSAPGSVTSGVVTLAVETEPVGELHLGLVDDSTETNYTVDFGFWQATPTIKLIKYTNGEDADVPTGPEVAYGGVVTWTYDITNTGNVTLTNVTLVDDKEGSITCPQQQLLPGEGMTCILTGIASTLGQYANTAVVTGTPTIFPTKPVTDRNPSHYITRPFSLGNRVWLDDGAGGGAANDGVQNGGEPGIAGVTVNLLDSSGAPVLDANQQPITTVTAGDGCYLFDNLRRGDYIVEIAAANFNAAQPLAGHVSSSGNSASGLAPSPNTDIDLDDNGNDVLVNQAIRSGVVTLELNSEPLGEALCGAGSGNALDQNSNLTVDFGFWQVTPTIKLIKYTNGEDADVPTGPEVAYGGVVTWTYDITNTGNVTLTNVTLVDDKEGSITCPQQQLLPGEGMTCILTGIASTLGQYANTAVVTGTPTIFPTKPVTDRNPSHYITRPFSLGNRVWLDDGAGGGAANDGVQNGGEPGIAGVTVNLLDSSGAPVLDANQQPISTVTASDGCYLFDNLRKGDYIVEIAAANFNAAQPLAGHVSSSGNSTGGLAPSPNTDIDLDDNGNDVFVNQAIRSGVVTLDLNSEPLGEALCGAGSGNALDQNSNLTVDFGFVFVSTELVSVGNLVWIDGDDQVEEPTDNNGLRDPGEPGLANVLVRLFDINETLIATTTTDVNGNYRFSNLLPGQYIVEIRSPQVAGDPLLRFSSSTGGPAGSTTGPYEPAPDPDNDIDNDDNGTEAIDPQVIRALPVTLSVGGEPTGPDNDDPNYNPTVDFGLYQQRESQALANIGDFVWEDANCDGIQEPNAQGGIPNITVRLYKGTGELLATTTTDVDGFYHFDNLEPGDYFIEFVKPDNYTYSPVKQGVDIFVDSDAAAVSQGSNIARSDTTTLVADETDDSWDAGLCTPTNLDPGDEPGSSQSTIFLPLIQQ